MNNIWVILGLLVLVLIDKRIRNWKEKRHVEKLAEKLYIATAEVYKNDIYITRAENCFKAAEAFVAYRDIQRIVNRGMWFDRRLAWFERQIVKFNGWLKARAEKKAPRPRADEPLPQPETPEESRKVMADLEARGVVMQGLSGGKWFQQCASCLNPFYSRKGPESRCPECKKPPPRET